MRLAGTEYSLDAQAFDIFVSGCTRNCYNCFNKAEQDFNYGNVITDNIFDSLICKINSNLSVIKKIRIMGGDLLCQDEEEALKFIVRIRRETALPIILYTGAEKKEIPNWCFGLFDGIKYGRYEYNKQCDSKLYGSYNQHYIIKNEYGEWKEIV